MKKKIMMGLGAITAIAAPVVGLVSCGDKESIADKMMDIFPDKITVPANYKSVDTITKLKGLTTDGAEISGKKDKDMKPAIIGLISKVSNIQSKIDNLRNKDEKDFFDKTKEDDPKAKIDIDLTVKKGFADNKITITMKITALDLKPDIISRGTASKDIEITFATA